MLNWDDYHKEDTSSGRRCRRGNRRHASRNAAQER